ncbi:MAG: Cytochrome c oxidase subunit 1 [uncultured Sulfurimonas sp.]|nr:MAG: Cytochrome c oxidase subunit 1 [uncultured Sulfurimonas sp.]
MSKSYFDETHCAIGHPKTKVMQWLLTVDHKRIGVMYAAVMFTFFFIAIATAMAMRIELFAPGAQIMDGDTFNQAFTLHGVIMIFLFIIPGIPAVFGNIVMPLMIGAKDVSFPRLNWFTFWLYILGCLIALSSLWTGNGFADTGWTFYAPYSLNTDTNVITTLVAAFVLGMASILTGLNFLVTIHRLRAPGMDFFKMPLFVWGIYATAWIQLLATPVVGITLILAILEKYFGIGIFDPAKGGDPVLFEHLFWIYSHPAVYLMILPAFGIMSEIIPVFSRREIFGYRTIALSSASIAGIGYLVWGHHLFTSGMSDIAKTIFSFLTFFVAIPTGIKFYDWIATMYKGKVILKTPMLWALGTIITFAIGGLTGVTIAMVGADIHLQDTYYSVAHFHYAILGGVVFLFFAGLHYWYPVVTGRMYKEGVAKVAFWLNFVGINLLWFPMFIAGYYGMPRRYFDYLPEFEIYHQISGIGAIVILSGLLLMFWNFLSSWNTGELSGTNPWEGTTLEWHLPSSPPPLENHTKVPYVDFNPYEYHHGKPVVKFDYETMKRID